MEHQDSPAKARTGDGDTSRMLRRTFYTALLLTTNIQQAEFALTEAIELWNPGCESEEAFLEKAIIAALNVTMTESTRLNQIAAAESLFPVELWGVLHLPRDIRHSYVLRILLAFPKELVAHFVQRGDREMIKNIHAGVVERAPPKQRESYEHTT